MKTALRKMHQNLWWAIGYNLIAFPVFYRSYSARKLPPWRCRAVRRSSLSTRCC